jgi:hypothetical protein
MKRFYEMNDYGILKKDSISETEINGRGDPCADHVTTLYPQKLVLTSPTGGGRSIGIICSRTKAMEFSLGVYSISECLKFNVFPVSQTPSIEGPFTQRL